MYTENNEDLELVIKALNVKERDNVAVVTSSGCAAFASLIFDPSSVIGFDINEAQTEYAQLRKAAYASLSLDSYKALFGLREATSGYRISIYSQIKHLLNEETSRFWDLRSNMILEGLANQSYFYKKMKMVADTGKLLKKAHLGGLVKVAELAKKSLPSKRLRKYAENYDLEQLISGEVKDEPLMRIFDDIKDFTPWFMKGNSYDKIKTNIGRVKFCTMGMTQGLKGLSNINSCYLSNIMDYLTEKENEELFLAAEESSLSGGKILTLQRTANFNLSLFIKGTRLEIENDGLAKESRAVAYYSNPCAKITLLRKR